MWVHPTVLSCPFLTRLQGQEGWTVLWLHMKLTLSWHTSPSVTWPRRWLQKILICWHLAAKRYLAEHLQPPHTPRHYRLLLIQIWFKILLRLICSVVYISIMINLNSLLWCFLSFALNWGQSCCCLVCLGSSPILMHSPIIFLISFA